MALHSELVGGSDGLHVLGMPLGDVSLEEWQEKLPGVRVYNNLDCEGWPAPLVLPALEALEKWLCFALWQ